MATALRQIYQIKISLEGARPPIWRRLLVPSAMKLSDLHDTIQIAMGWEDYHLHQYRVGETFIGLPDPELNWTDIEDERKVRLDKVLVKEKDRLRYEYDFGDGWEHIILLEKILPHTNETTLPQCIKGKRACPPEDVGGVWGYGSFLEIISDPKHSEHEEMLDWVGGEFDPEAFDMEEINARLAEAFKR